MISKKELAQIRELAISGGSPTKPQTLKMVKAIEKLKEEVRLLKRENTETIKAILEGSFEI